MTFDGSERTAEGPRSDQYIVSDKTVVLPEVLSVLRRHRSRQILLSLLRYGSPTTVDEPTAHIAAMDAGSLTTESQEGREYDNGQFEP